jgi:hypothetical protein
MHVVSSRPDCWEPGQYFTYLVYVIAWGAKLLHDRTYETLLATFPDKGVTIDFRRKGGEDSFNPTLVYVRRGGRLWKELQHASLHYDVEVYRVGITHTGLVPWAGEPLQIKRIRITNRAIAKAA